MEELGDGLAGPREGLTTEQAEALVLRLIADHADSLLRVARRYSICADDAQDAYQRGLEILMRHAWRLDPERAAGWLHTVVRHEAIALNRGRRRYLGPEEVDVDRLEARTSRSPEEAVLGLERVERAAAALKQLKPQELRALWLKALGHSYQEICERTGWTYTKVNRSMAEGRRSFLERYAGIEAGEECERLAPQLSALVDGEADAESLVELRAHLRHCLACKAAIRHLHDATDSLAVVFPLGGLVVAEVAEPASHLVVRLYEAAVVALNERAATSILRAQAVIEAVTATKVAAVASAAVAMTGGGLAVGQAVQHGERAGLPDGIGGVALAPATVSLRSGAATKQNKNSPTPSRRTRQRKRAGTRARARVATDAGASQPRSPAPVVTAPQARPAGNADSASAPAASASVGEFSFE